jgi:hypothetical protein
MVTAKPQSRVHPLPREDARTSRPGVAARVTIVANLNSPDGSYQGPTTIVGQGQFSAT